MSRFLRDRLIVRVVLHGVLLLGISAAGFLAVTLGLLSSGMDHEVKTFTAWFGAEACERLAHSRDAEAEIAAFPAAVTVFSEDGRTLATSSPRALPPLSPDELARLRRGEPVPLEPGRLVAVACHGTPGRYAVGGGPPMTLPIGSSLLLVAALVLVVGLGSIPLARSLVRPLRELVSTANVFGKGELTARATVTHTDEIGDLARAFNRMASNLHAHLMSEKELLANVSHELRTPLARVRVVLETAKEDPSRAAALLDEISRDLTDLERLTDDVLATIRLDFSASTAEAARLRVRPERVNVVEVLQRAVARCVEDHPDREIELEATGAPTVVPGDPALLLRLFENLLENARKYSSSAIRVHVQTDAATVRIDVLDAGIGIEKADLERVFEPFFRSDRSRGRASGGTGLGLTLCRRIVEVHGGEIRAESEPGVGTTVTVSLPLGS